MFAPDQDPDELPTQYDPAAVEVATFQRWEEAGYFTADPQQVLSGAKKPFSIVLPPPNVTGALHVGHALDQTIMDVLTRWHRMSGDETLWLPGMDHAGIATQNVVEKQLAVDGKTRFDFGRELFVQKVWDWKHDSGGQILGQMRRLGTSVDWSRERFTLDDGLSRAVATIFKNLYDDGLIYRANRMIHWCPGCGTALSDIEVEHSDDAGELVTLRYGSADGGADSVEVATTRVETMLGDTAVAVHPDDERYRHLVGRTVTLPIVGREIPVIADDLVDPSFGTGAVKVTPAHDPNDFEIGRRHHLPMPTVLDETAHITGTGTVFDGLDRFEARAAVKEELRRQGRVVAERIPYVHSVGHCQRSDDVVEPRLSLQWFVRVAPLAKAAGDAVRDGRTRIHPPEMAARYFEWVDNMHDWTISRQLWWGHRIPVWYGPDGAVRCIGPDEQPPAADSGWTQDPDVLDTWFSSGLWPFSTLGWPDSTPELAAFYPTSVLVTGYDILFFWVARMMMLGLYAMGRSDRAGASLGTDAIDSFDAKNSAVPFRVVALHGMVRDGFGRKMSKSRGNVVDPMEWVERYGADAVRLTLARGANPGSDQATAEEWVQGSRNFCNKLFNVTRFALLNGASVPETPPDRTVLGDADVWILDRLDETVQQTTAFLGDFQIGKAAEALYHFTWDEFCDWYIEFAKVAIYGEPTAAAQTRDVVGYVLDQLLRLLHPFVPFVTERLWKTLTGEETVVTAAWPHVQAIPAEQFVAQRIATAQQLITEIRRFRADQGLPATAKLPAAIDGLDGNLAGIEPLVRSMARLTEAPTGLGSSAALAVGLASGRTVQIDIDTSSAVDVDAEIARLTKDLAAAEKELADSTTKLGNPAFVERAPAPVVDKIRGRHQRASADIDRITTRIDQLEGGGSAG